ncbi:TPA: PaaR repeat-containing protein, partial [Candidatus Woesearchaeota archaeon]|nr:PaaR repeat-containing protein [Candidatus Woesearchaeota archaeon]
EVHRKGDLCTGHDCWPPRPNNQGSPDVFTNDIPQHRITDSWSSHCCGPPCHGANTIEGSPDVFVNDLKMARKTDDVSCGSKCGTHSPDVWANE